MIMELFWTYYTDMWARSLMAACRYEPARRIRRHPCMGSFPRCFTIRSTIVWCSTGYWFGFFGAVLEQDVWYDFGLDLSPANS
jgi:hypothetical protein